MRSPQRQPAPEVIQALRTELGHGDPALGFAEAVLAHAASPSGVTRDREMAVATRISAILSRAAAERSAGESDWTSDEVHALAADPILLAAFFQNVDLLFQAGAPEAERVGLLIMSAVESLGGG